MEAGELAPERAPDVCAREADLNQSSLHLRQHALSMLRVPLQLLRHEFLRTHGLIHPYVFRVLRRSCGWCAMCPSGANDKGPDRGPLIVDKKKPSVAPLNIGLCYRRTARNTAVQH